MICQRVNESCARHGVRVARWHLASPQQSTHPLARRPGMPPYTTSHARITHRTPHITHAQPGTTQQKPA